MSAQTAKKAAKPRSTPSHPSFKDMIAAAIQALADKKGSSRHAIRKYIAANYKVSETAMKANLNKSLAKLLASNFLAHPKTSTGLYKLVKSQEATKKPKAKKTAAAKKKVAAKKPKAEGVKKAPSKKPKAKKSTASKKTVKKPAKKAVKKATTKKPAAKKTPKKAAKKPAKKTTAAKKK